MFVYCLFGESGALCSGGWHLGVLSWKKKPFYAVSSFWSCNKCILCNYCSCSVEDSCILLVVPDNSLYTQIWMIQSSKMMERFRRCKEVGGTKRVMDEKTSGGIKR